MVRGVPEVFVVDNPDKDANDSDDFREGVTKIVQFTL